MRDNDYGLGMGLQGVEAVSKCTRHHIAVELVNKAHTTSFAFSISSTFLLLIVSEDLTLPRL